MSSGGITKVKVSCIAVIRPGLRGWDLAVMRKLLQGRVKRRLPDLNSVPGLFRCAGDPTASVSLDLGGAPALNTCCSQEVKTMKYVLNVTHLYSTTHPRAAQCA